MTAFIFSALCLLGLLGVTVGQNCTVAKDASYYLSLSDEFFMKQVTGGSNIGGCRVYRGGSGAACYLYATAATTSSKGYNGWPRTPDGRGTGCVHPTLKNGGSGQRCFFRDPAYNLSASLVASFCTSSDFSNAAAQLKHAVRNGACNIPSPPIRGPCTRGQPGCVCKSGPNEQCIVPSDCPEGYVCHGGKCRKEMDLNERCDPIWVCRSGLQCVGGKCSRYVGNNFDCGREGAICTSDHTCSSNTRRCAKVLERNARCEDLFSVCPSDQQCISFDNKKYCMTVVGRNQGCYEPQVTCEAGLRCVYEYKHFGTCRSAETGLDADGPTTPTPVPNFNF